MSHSVYGTKTLDKTVVIITHKQPPIFYDVLQICVCVPRKNVSFKAHRLLAHNANVLL